MKNFTQLFLVAVLTTMGLCASLDVCAQAVNWKGHDVATVAAVTDKNSDDGLVCLYNVGAKKYIALGDHWGVQPKLRELPRKLHIESATENQTASNLTVYRINSKLDVANTPYLGFVRKGTTNGDSYIGGDGDNADKPDEDYGLYMDRSINLDKPAITKMIFTKVDGTEADTYIYNISFVNIPTLNHQSDGQWTGDVSSATKITYYVVGDESGNVKAVTDAPTDEYGQWIIVSIGDFKSRISNADVPGFGVANATYLIDSPEFDCQDKASQWFNKDGKNVTLVNEVGSADWSSIDVCNLGLGNIPQKVYGNDNPQFAAIRREYGYLWAGDILGQNKMYQDVTNLTPGWYIVYCRGFQETEGASKAKLFAQTGSGTGVSFVGDANALHEIALNAVAKGTFQSKTETLNEVQCTLPRQIAAGLALRNSQVYVKSLMIYVGDNKTLRLGVDAMSSAANATSVEAADWTCFDNFELYYVGSNESPIVFDENQKSVEYINVQRPTKEGQDIVSVAYLKRTFNLNGWNTVVFPFSLRRGQAKNAFGANTKLSKLSSTAGNNIYFESIDLLNGYNPETVIEAGKLYIIKPENAPYETGDYETTITGVGEGNANLPIKLEGGYYVIDQVYVPAELTSGTVTGNIVESEIDNGIAMEGTYVNETVVPSGSYLMKLKDGVSSWYYYKQTDTSKNVKVKGFRAWIATGKNNATQSSEQHANLSFFLNGISMDVEGDGTSSIEDLFADSEQVNGDIYNVSGQLVRRNATSTLGLSKGVYVVNGKKIVVK